MRPIITAFRFLTILPIPVRGTASEHELGQAVAYFPLVGVVLGAVLAVASWGLSQIFPAHVTAVLILVLWVVLSGALHLDAWLDACDGIFGGQTPEQRLHIMRDERIGAFALAGGVLLLLSKYAALAEQLSGSALPLSHGLRWPLFLLLPSTLGRFAMSLAIVGFPYARAQGLGRVFKDQAGWSEVAIAGGIALAMATAVAGLPGVLLWAGTISLTWLLARWTLRRLPGLTGDIYGALCEIVELVVLLVWTAGA
ncbi:MAG: adenosylcobinamide-GDP ribazoletransferase [Caldilineae bacterium]|nr:MAG: adenosylcobinamide-GDP ribazoletransferase [Caldilineae bacterium]